MKINMPVTQQEVHLQPGKPIVSKTDLKGSITYVNQSFVDISGFNREELIGKNHNLVRHPDMPPAAFAWLWDTVKSDMPWRGLVKNRCKNGDFYWVEAYVTPIKQNGITTGYMSVRNTPARDEVKACDELYKKIREGTATLPKRNFKINDISLYTRINIIFSIMFLMLGGSSVYYLTKADSMLDNFVAAIAGMGTLLVVVASLWLRSSIKKFMGKTSSALGNIAEGNFIFSVGVDNRDEFGRTLNEIESMRINLRAIIADVMLAAKTVDSGSKLVVSEMQNLLQRSTDQADRVTGMSAATEQMHQSIAHASELTQAASDMADATSATVQRGSQHMGNSIASVEKIVQVVNNSRTTLLNLTDSTQRIGQISMTIKDVADQTNLLALNAAIEAARAGEQGRGFAVVADEVRKLAERTSRSTLDISETVQNIKDITIAAVNTLENAVTEVARGTQHIQESSDNLTDILKASNKGKEMSNEISTMLQEQAVAMQDIAQHMSEIFTLASDNADGVSKTKDTTEKLAHTATELDLLVKHFEKSL
jgi:aerotaxis receptor